MGFFERLAATQSRLALKALSPGKCCMKRPCG